MEHDGDPTRLTVSEIMDYSRRFWDLESPPTAKAKTESRVWNRGLRSKEVEAVDGRGGTHNYSRTLSDEDYKLMMAAGACFRCFKTGHSRLNCEAPMGIKISAEDRANLEFAGRQRSVLGGTSPLTTPGNSRQSGFSRGSSSGGSRGSTPWYRNAQNRAAFGKGKERDDGPEDEEQ